MAIVEANLNTPTAARGRGRLLSAAAVYALFFTVAQVAAAIAAVAVLVAYNAAPTAVHGLAVWFVLIGTYVGVFWFGVCVAFEKARDHYRGS